MIKILIADDDKLISAFITKVLKNHPFELFIANDGAEAVQLFREIQPDLVLLDIMMPKMDGFQVCSHIRQSNQRVPILMLSAKLQTEDKVAGLKLGADDYITKPFDRHELVARIETSLRRAALLDHVPEVSDGQPLDIDGLQIIPETRQVFFHDHEIKLSKTEFNLLKIFGARVNQILDRDTLFQEVWGYEFAGATRTVDNFVMRLRKKLNELLAEHGKEYPFIETLYGVGYRMRSSSQ